MMSSMARGDITSETIRASYFTPRWLNTCMGRSPSRSVEVMSPSTHGISLTTNSRRTPWWIMVWRAWDKGMSGAIVAARTWVRSVITERPGDSSVTGWPMGGWAWAMQVPSGKRKVLRVECFTVRSLF
jgi:hypothetical protein